MVTAVSPSRRNGATDDASCPIQLSKLRRHFPATVAGSRRPPGQHHIERIEGEFVGVVVVELGLQDLGIGGGALTAALLECLSNANPELLV